MTTYSRRTFLETSLIAGTALLGRYAVEIGDGMTQPAVMAAALSIEPRLAGTASGLMGFLQMTMAALGSFVVALLPNHNAFGLIAVFGAFVALSLTGAILAVIRSAREGQATLPTGAPATAAEGN